MSMAIKPNAGWRLGEGGCREVDALGKLVLLAWNAVLYQSNYSCWRDAEARLWLRECVRVRMLQRQRPPHPHISPSTDCKRGRAGSLLMGWMGREMWGIRRMERQLSRTMAVLGRPCSGTPPAWPASVHQQLRCWHLENDKCQERTRDLAKLERCMRKTPAAWDSPVSSLGSLTASHRKVSASTSCTFCDIHHEIAGWITMDGDLEYRNACCLWEVTAAEIGLIALGYIYFECTLAT